MFLIVLNLWSRFVMDANCVLEAGQMTYTRFASNDKAAWSEVLAKFLRSN
jgi:hypothetical protein